MTARSTHGSGRPLALGIHWAHDASAALCSPEGVICAIAEERLTRIKHYYGFPCRAIAEVLRFAGITAADVDIFAVSTKRVFYPSHANHFTVDLDGSCAPGPHAPARKGLFRHGGLLSSARALIEEGLGSPERKREKRAAQVRESWGEFAERHWVFQDEFLRGLGLLDERVAHYHVHHHRAHASSAFRLSGLEAACVLSIDGKGDGTSAAVFRGHPDGRLELLRESPSTDSLGSFYQAVTEALGFIPADGEYKTMGLAALGKPGAGPNPFAGTVSVRDGVLRSRVEWRFRDYNRANPGNRVENPLSSVSHSDEYRSLLAGLSREQFAFFAQEHFQENMLGFARDALEVTGLDALAAAGGVMLNVKANAAIRDRLRPSRFFVFPDSADSGLSIGAALEALHQTGALEGPLRFSTPYLGHGHPDADVEEALRPWKDTHRLGVSEASPARVARLLAQGKVIGTFLGRMEIGPRALGNRSVLADPRSAAVKDRINLILKGRDWFVPFAPVLLEEDAGLYWEGSSDYRHMTFAVEASEHARRTVPAVVHVDGTMRPQVVGPRDNPWIHELLAEFKKETGVGVLLNTSFNRHGLPIVGSPADALEHLARGWVDGVVLGSRYVERP